MTTISSNSNFDAALRMAKSDGIVTEQEKKQLLKEAMADGQFDTREIQALQEIGIFPTSSEESACATCTGGSTTVQFVPSTSGETEYELPLGAASDVWASDTLESHFSKIDTDGDGKLSKTELEAAAKDSTLNDEVRMAAQYAAENFDRFAGAAVGDSEGVTGISTGDLAAASAYGKLDDNSAIESTLSNFAGLDADGDGQLTRADLEATLADENASPEEKATARYLLDNPAVFEKMDSAVDGETDEIVTRADIESAAREVQSESTGTTTSTTECPTETTTTTDPSTTYVAPGEPLAQSPEADGWAGGVLAENYEAIDNDGDGSVSEAELRSAANDDSLSPEVRLAAQYALDNMSQFEGAAGGDAETPGITKGDFETMEAYAGMGDKAAVEGFLEHWDALHWDDTGSAEELQQKLDEGNLTPEQAAIAKYLLANPELLERLDSAKNGETDGKIGKGDLEVMARTLPDDEPKTEATYESVYATFYPVGTTTEGHDHTHGAGEHDHATHTPGTHEHEAEYGGVQNGGAGAHGLDGNSTTSEINALFSDPTLTVEDLVVLLLMLIMKQMDEQIKKQAEKIRDMNAKGTEAQGGATPSQDGTAGKSGVDPTETGEGATGTDGDDTSIDVETMKLKRLTDKRGQMFDMLKAIVDKYNETAKGAIQGIAR